MPRSPSTVRISLWTAFATPVAGPCVLTIKLIRQEGVWLCER